MSLPWPPLHLFTSLKCKILPWTWGLSFLVNLLFFLIFSLPLASFLYLLPISPHIASNLIFINYSFLCREPTTYFVSASLDNVLCVRIILVAPFSICARGLSPSNSHTSNFFAAVMLVANPLLLLFVRYVQSSNILFVIFLWSQLSLSSATLCFQSPGVSFSLLLSLLNVVSFTFTMLGSCLPAFAASILLIFWC